MSAQPSFENIAAFMGGLMEVFDHVPAEERPAQHALRRAGLDAVREFALGFDEDTPVAAAVVQVLSVPALVCALVDASMAEEFIGTEDEQATQVFISVASRLMDMSDQLTALTNRGE